MRDKNHTNSTILTASDKAILCAKLADDFKAEQIVVLNVEGICSYADYFVICSGRSTRQVQGIADNIEEQLRKRGIKPLGIEGWREGLWVLMDYEDVIIHIFYSPIREVYDLEGLWADAKNIQISGVTAVAE